MGIMMFFLVVNNGLLVEILVDEVETAEGRG